MTRKTAQPKTFTAKIPTYRLNLFARVVGPLLWVKNYIDELKDDILQMIWRELFKNERDHDQTTHFLAFAGFSIFCLVAYQGFEDYMVYFFYALWPLDYVVGRYSFKRSGYERVSLKLQAAELTWQSRNARGLLTEKYDFKPSQVRGVVVRGTLYEGNAYSSVKTHAWEVFIQTAGLEQEEWIIHHEARLQQALRKAVVLARTFDVPLNVADSCGQGSFAETQVEPMAEFTKHTLWRSTDRADGFAIHKSPRTVDVFKLIRAVLDEAGSFIFIAVMSGVMERYGMFLTWMLGPRLGFADPFMLYLDFSFKGIWGFFAPDLDWEFVSILTITALAIFYSAWKTARHQVFTLTSHHLTYQFGNQREVVLPRAEIRHILLLYTPEPILLLVSKNQMLLLDNFYDTEEQEELYAKLLAGFDKTAHKARHKQASVHQGQLL